MGSLPGWRALSAPLRGIAAERRAMGKVAFARRRWPARISGAVRVISLIEPFVRPVLRLLDAGNAQRLAIAALKLPPHVKLTRDDPALAVRPFGLNFPNPAHVAPCLRQP